METSTELTLNKDFADWVRAIKNEIRSAQLKAATKVNSELLHLYWHMGAEICEKQKSATWGDGWLKELSRELMIEFPSMNGFSYRNLRNMKQWYLFYNQGNIIWQQPVAKLGGKGIVSAYNPNNQGDTFVQQAVAQLGRESSVPAYSPNNQEDIIGQQAVAQLQDIFFSVPWGHHLYILSQCKTVDKAIFFLSKTVENGWSRAVLLNFLDTDLYERQGKAVSNFSRLLPDVQSDLAAQTLKDPYNFDFLTLTDNYRERELEDALTQNITRFLLELGQGFAFVGEQIPLEIGDETLFADLLFYHLELRCYVVIELKSTKFKAEHLGQLGVYISAINHQKKKPTDNPTIGLLICKDKNDVMAQYSLEASAYPIGISEYQLSQLMPEELKSQLPAIEEIEASLTNLHSEGGDD